MSEKRIERKPRYRVWVSLPAGWVRITVPAGGRVEWAYGGPTDEGFCRTWESLEEYDGVIYSRAYTRSRDCDGLWEEWNESECPVDQLRSKVGIHEWTFGNPEPVPAFYHLPRRGGVAEGRIIEVPAWERGHSEQRDHFAEAAGY